MGVQSFHLTRLRGIADVRIEDSLTFESLNSRLEGNAEEKEDCKCACGVFFCACVPARSHREMLMIHKLGLMRLTTQNDLY